MQKLQQTSGPGLLFQTSALSLALIESGTLSVPLLWFITSHELIRLYHWPEISFTSICLVRGLAKGVLSALLN